MLSVHTLRHQECGRHKTPPSAARLRGAVGALVTRRAYMFCRCLSRPGPLLTGVECRQGGVFVSLAWFGPGRGSPSAPLWLWVRNTVAAGWALASSFPFPWASLRNSAYSVPSPFAFGLPPSAPFTLCLAWSPRAGADRRLADERARHVSRDEAYHAGNVVCVQAVDCARASL